MILEGRAVSFQFTYSVLVAAELPPSAATSSRKPPWCPQLQPLSGTFLFPLPHTLLPPDHGLPTHLLSEGLAVFATPPQSLTQNCAGAELKVAHL